MLNLNLLLEEDLEAEEEEAEVVEPSEEVSEAVEEELLPKADLVKPQEVPAEVDSEEAEEEEELKEAEVEPMLTAMQMLNQLKIELPQRLLSSLPISHSDLTMLDSPKY
jgi:hypothetical protein